MDDFSKHPKSITEIKGDKSGKGDDWKPRDALIAALRDLDSGATDPSMIFIAYHCEKTKRTGYYQCAGTKYESVGLLSFAIDLVKGE